MKRRLIFVAVIFFSLLSFEKSDKNLVCTSPDGAIKLLVETKNLAGKACFSIVFNHDTIVKATSLGIIVDDDQYSFASGLSLQNTEKKVIDEVYEMKTGKQLKRINHCNELLLRLKNPSENMVNLVFRVYDDGVAYRYELNNNQKIGIKKEYSEFHFNGISKIWASNYSKFDEQPFQKWRSVPEIVNTNLSFPVLVNTSSNYWVLVSEANVSNYPLSVGKFDGNHLYYTFPSAIEGINTVEQNYISPWRLMILGKDLNTIVESCLIDHLAPPTKIKDLSWVVPGITSFPWWGDNLANSNPESIKKYIDLSAAMNWRYVEFDIALIGSPSLSVEKWKSVNWIKDVTDYGKQKGVYCYGWDDFKNLNSPDKRKDIFQRYNDLGIVGIKVDFVDSYTQQTRSAVEELIRDAAQYRLMVSFHGAPSPRGFARQYPNVVTFEAVRGAEYYLTVNGEKGVTPQHNCTLPFTRNVLGSMDYTPVAFSSKIRQTTMAHELALSVIFESGWQVMCDVPESYLNSVAKPFLSQLQTAWDETKFLDGYPGEYCCLARRKGNTWFIAGINSGDARIVSLKLPISGSCSVQVYNDLDNGLNSLGSTEYSISGEKPFEITIQENGGFAMIVEISKTL